MCLNFYQNSRRVCALRVQTILEIFSVLAVFCLRESYKEKGKKINEKFFSYCLVAYCLNIVFKNG